MMLAAIARFRAALARDRVRAECAGVALLALVLSVAIGSLARRKAIPLRMEIARLSALDTELATFRSSFRAGAPELDDPRLPDSLAVGVAREARVTLAHDIAARAERSGLLEVRVRFAPIDTVVPTPVQHPDFFRGASSVADYTIAVECRGGFSAVLSFVNHLPPSVTLERFTAAGTKDGVAQYHLMLGVLESARPAEHG
jgi:hypothetical protein